jgi:hypothetical protein
MDAPLLTVAAEVEAAVAADAAAHAHEHVDERERVKLRSPVDAAIRIVDRYGAQLGATGDGDGDADRDRDGDGDGKVELQGVYRTARRSVPLDTGALNMLLKICGREGYPGPAFRLYRLARERWGILPDDESLTLLMMLARQCAIREQDSMENRLQMMKDTFTLRRFSERLWRAPLTRSAKPSETRALLDPPGYSWRSEYGTRQPVDLARSAFEDVIFANWPALKYTPSPLKHGPLADLGALLSPRRLGGAPPTPGARADESAPYAHLVPGPRAWDAYIKLVAYHFPDEDLPLRLAYMRALRVVPAWDTMLVALNMVGEREGPRIRIATAKHTGLMRDEQAIRAYLEDWLGEDDKVPSETDVAEYRRGQQARRAEFVSARIRRQREGEDDYVLEHTH